MLMDPSALSGTATRAGPASVGSGSVTSGTVAQDSVVSNGVDSGFVVEKRKRDLLELSVGYGLILFVIWAPNPWQRLLYWAALGWVVLTTCVSFEGRRAMGLRIGGLLRSLWVVGVALLMAGIAGVVANRIHTLHLPGGLSMLVERYWAYGIWAFLQQFLLLDFFLLRLLRLLPNRKSAVVAAASLFAIAHVPNPILTPLTLIWGLAACLIFLAYRNLYTLGMAHAILGICIAVTVPGPVDHNMRVGLGYLAYRAPGHHRHRSHRDQIVSTEAWVIAEAATRRS
jgi:hypothetical protein